MSNLKCPLGDDCDATLAYMLGVENARDAVKALRAENERLRAALIVWRNAYKTGRNEPLVQAYEHLEALAAQPAPGKEEA